jgi:hypothetical protein
MPRKLTQAEFIERATRKHGGKYTYPQAVYVAGKSKLTITCPDHGDFEQTPSCHLQGQGCPMCGKRIADAVQSKRREAAGARFVADANNVHDGLYTYPRAVYRGAHVDLFITCFKHGDFRQKPQNHIGKQAGCPNCAPNRKLGLDGFLERANAVHGIGTYDYSLVVLRRVMSNVLIICPMPGHGKFEQLPNNHMRGAGCPACFGTPRSTTEAFIEEARSVWDGRYGYARTVYGQGRRAPVIVTCGVHGDLAG